MLKAKISPKVISISFSILVLAFLLGFYILAWQEPTQPPPSGNVPAPINVGATAQGKLGSLGIGIQTPASRLHIKDGQSWGSDLSIDATGLSGGRRWLLISTGGNASEGQGKFLIKDNNASAVRLTIDTTGNVGIGTTSPTQKLDVAGNLKLNSNQAIQMRLENASSHPVGCGSSTVGYIYFNTSINQACLCRQDGWSCYAVPPGTPNDRFVFVTSSIHNGLLHGLAGADAICQARAQAACDYGLTSLCGKTFRAWLSVYPNDHAKYRVGCDNSKRYIMLTNHGYNYAVIADNCDDLVDGDIDHPINHDEYGGRVSGGFFVWTNTDAKGYARNEHQCREWRTPYHGYYSEKGLIGGHDEAWTQVGIGFCDELLHLYCFQF